jgi:zinc carboxypeptidase/immune inhibitor InhA-like protein
MKRWTIVACVLALLTFAGTASAKAPGTLNLYSAKVGASGLQKLTAGGYDVASVRQEGRRTEVFLVLSKAEAGKVRKDGVRVRLVRDSHGRTQLQRASLQAAGGFNVWRSYDEPGGIRDELYEVAADNPDITKLEVIGETEQGREILAIRLTRNAGTTADGSKPSVLYVATHHAREWISTEVDRRLLHWYIDRYREDNAQIRNLLGSTELWFVPVHNPDGYQYTFDAERLWRKNLHDNDGDHTITNADGVDPNRNYPEHWNYDEEGSESQFTSETYRGDHPASEPETQALMGLHARVGFEFSISYHSFGPLLLYPQGWQVQTPSADDPIYLALTGDDGHPAAQGFNPGVSADLYTTNGEYTDWAHSQAGTLAWTPELEEGCDGCGFVFPDNETLVEKEFKTNRQFAVNVAKSAVDPDDPASHWGLDTQTFYLDLSQVDAWKSGNPASDLKVETSFGGGSSQTVEVLAKRSAGAVALRYRINGGAVRTATTSESPDGDRYGGNNAYNVYYHYLRGGIPVSQGNSVEYWFTAGGEASEHVTFNVVEDADADVLVLAQEDYSGLSNVPAYASTTSPNYLSYYTNALTANGITYDVYDVDAMGRQAPDHLGVLSHYDAVIWYKGNDFVTREPGWTAGNSSRLANDLMLEARAYLNEGGKLLYAGQWAGAVENGLAGTQLFDPVANKRCVGSNGSVLHDRCQVISDKNDFWQYYLGGYIYNSDAGTGPDGPFDVDGVSGGPYDGLTWGFNGADSAANQLHTASFITTSSLLKPDVYPQFTSDAPAMWNTGFAGPFEPFDGDWYVYSQMANVTFKRLTRTIDLTGVSASDSPTLTFHTSYDTEPDWDFVFVEAHTVGQDDWTTLPDENGHTSQNTGPNDPDLASCPAGWHELHPWLARYQTFDGVGACTPTGTTGEWNAASGRSAGWEEWAIDLSAYAGKQVEISFSYASDWAVQGLGNFLDDVQMSTGAGSTSFETDLGGWTPAGPPEGSAPNANNYIRTESVGFEEGAIVSTEDTLYFGFGFEGISDAARRNEVMGASMDYLLP